MSYEKEKDTIQWVGDYGFYPVQNSNYDKLYFEKYVGYSQTELGKKITNFRVDFVSRYTKGFVLDIGIGCGHFIDQRNKETPDKVNTFGFDVNPAGINWLMERNLLIDYKNQKVDSVSMFDVFEHIEFPSQLLKQVKNYVFISIPIFQSYTHALESKHFRKDEHFWYFTENGLIKFMANAGFYLLEVIDMETRLGREDILTFAFKRV